MRLMRITGIILSIGILMGGSAAALPIKDPAERERIIARLEKSRQSFDSVRIQATAEIPQDASGPASENEHVISLPTVFYYQDPGLYRSEIRMGPEGTTITVSDGSFVTSYNTEQKTAYRQSAAKARADLLTHGPYDPARILLTPEYPLSDFFTITVEGTDQIEQKSCYRFRLIPHRPLSNYSSILLYVERDSMIPVLGVILKGEGEKERWISRLRVGRFEQGRSLDEELFRLSLPDDVQIVRM